MFELLPSIVWFIDHLELMENLQTIKSVQGTEKMADIISSLPAAFWVVITSVFTAIIASRATLRSVMISNEAAYKRQKVDLTHAEKERKNNEILTVRKSVYLSFAEALARKKISITTYCTIEMKEFAEIDKAFSAELSKILIIASDDTLQSCVEINAYLTKVSLELMPKRMPVDGIKSEIGVFQGNIKNLNDRRQQLLNNMSEYNLRGVTNENEWARLNNNYDANEEILEDFNNSYVNKLKELSTLQQDLFVEAYHKMVGVIEFEIEAVRCARKDLNMEFDIDVYRKILEAQMLEVKDYLTVFIDDINSKIEEVS